MYYIYHIEGVKIGCSKNPKRRVNAQGYTKFTILETHTDIQIASERERSLQKEYGFKMDNTPYNISIDVLKPYNNEGSKKGAAKIKELGIGIYSINKEQRIELGKEFGKKGIEWNKNNPQHLKNIQIIGGKIRGPIQGKINKENGHISQLGKQMTIYNNRLQTCPYCGKESKGIGYSRWHGENCKLK